MPADPFIAELRSGLTKLLRSEVDLPVYGWLPDDVAHIPCVAVGRPGAGGSDTAIVMTQTLDVVLLGRRVNDEDSSAELDGYADETFAALGGTRGVKLGDEHLRCVEYRSGVVNVAGLDFPAYSFTVARDVMTC